LLYIKGHVAPSSSDSGSCGNLIIDFYWVSYFCWSDSHSFWNCLLGFIWGTLVLL